MESEYPEVDYLVEPAGECIRFKTKSGASSHYCFSIPYKNCPRLFRINNPVGQGDMLFGGCIYSQYKPVWKRMQNKAKSK